MQDSPDAPAEPVGSRVDRGVMAQVPKRSGRPATTQLAVLSTLGMFTVPMSAGEVAHILGISRYVVWCALYRLHDAEKVERVGGRYRLKATQQAAAASWLAPLLAP